MDLIVEYIRDLPIPQYGEWTDAESHNWLHPSNGPLPDLHSMLSCLDGSFIGAVWDDYESLVVFLFLQDEPEGEVSEAAKIVGGIPRTFRWRLDENLFRCCGHVVKTPQWEGDERAWQKSLMKTTLIESVKLALTIPIGVSSESEMERLLRPADACPGKTPSPRQRRSPSTSSATPSSGRSRTPDRRSIRRLLPSLK